MIFHRKFHRKIQPPNRGVGPGYLITKLVSEADRWRKLILMPICTGEKYVQTLYTTAGIMKINFSEAQATKTSRSIHRQMSLGTVLLFKLPLYESCEMKFAKVRWFSEVPSRSYRAFLRSWKWFENSWKSWLWSIFWTVKWSKVKI